MCVTMFLSTGSFDRNVEFTGKIVCFGTSDPHTSFNLRVIMSIDCMWLGLHTMLLIQLLSMICA